MAGSPRPWHASFALSGSLSTWSQGRRHWAWVTLQPSVCPGAGLQCQREKGGSLSTGFLPTFQGVPQRSILTKVCSHGDGAVSVRMAGVAWPLQSWTLLSAQGVDVMKNGPQSPAGLNIVDFPSQLENTKGWAEWAWLGG